MIAQNKQENNKWLRPFWGHEHLTLDLSDSENTLSLNKPSISNQSYCDNGFDISKTKLSIYQATFLQTESSYCQNPSQLNSNH